VQWLSPMATRDHLPSAWLPHEIESFRDGMRLRAQRFRDQKKELNRNACRSNRGRKQSGAFE
ncbi:MAG: hypothetical protein ACK55I_27440, partial [bacterium]